ncbi:MAG: hypothetical protein KOO60_03340 [Gemmatimonadales bacterium]|nr:hypothetical protein [Gemmatimonadales bacterium]
MNKVNGSRYLITAMGGGLAFLCLALGLQLLSPDLPADLASWLEDGRPRNGFILALGGSLLSFLLGSGFVVAARKTLEFPHRRLGSRSPPAPGNPVDKKLWEVGARLNLAGQKLTGISVNPEQGPDSLERLNYTVEHLRETVQQTEDIVNSINEIAGLPDRPDTLLE